jgi:23S rRNA (adenine2503-C2)-methyltransferase
VLRGATQQINAAAPGRVMLEYLMLSGLTDTADDIEALQQFAAGLRVHINLIPFNAIDLPAGLPQAQLAPSPRPRIDDFAALLRAQGVPVTIRYSLGADVAAACGQLVQRHTRDTSLEPPFRSGVSLRHLNRAAGRG